MPKISHVKYSLSSLVFEILQLETKFETWMVSRSRFIKDHYSDYRNV